MTPTTQAEKPAFQPFVPYRRKTRKPGTGCVSQITETLWAGRYSPMWPDGMKHSRNVYAKTREECEEKLKGLIQEMKKEIAEVRKGSAASQIILMLS